MGAQAVFNIVLLEIPKRCNRTSPSAMFMLIRAGSRRSSPDPGKANDGEVLMVEANDNVSEFSEDLFMESRSAQISGQGAMACMYQFDRCDK